jgi:hypothetical protein
MNDLYIAVLQNLFPLRGVVKLAIKIKIPGCALLIWKCFFLDLQLRFMYIPLTLNRVHLLFIIILSKRLDLAYEITKAIYAGYWSGFLTWIYKC